MERRAGTGYYVEPPSGPGPGVLLLHSWWGLTDWFRGRADALADGGYSVLVPDLLRGARPETSAEAEIVLGAADMDAMADLVLSSVHALRTYSSDSREPIGTVGFAMGASWAMWLSARLPESIRAVVGFYGTQNIDFDASVADYQLHYALADEVVTADEVAETRALLGLAGRPVELFEYEGARHCFMEPDAGTYDADAAAVAWDRALAFLGSHLPVARGE
jgi:carboxymethylenebutenolidase